MYRAIETRLWPLLRGLDGASTRLFLYLWMGPHSKPYGILQVPDDYALHDLDWRSHQLRKAWTALDAADLVWREGDLAIIVPFLMSNPPLNENVVKAWRKALVNLPDSPLYAKLYERAAVWLTDEGLAWLTAKAGIVSEQFPNSFDTVAKLSIQHPVSSSQHSKTNMQQQESRGSGGGEPDAGLCSASPLDAASLRPALPIGPLNEEPKAASKENGTDRTDKLRSALNVGLPDAAIVRSGYTIEEVQAMRHELGL